MPIIDLPLDQLYTYQGRNPRPDDFDAYWDRAISEMKAIDPQVEMIPVDIGANFAECFDFWFTGVRGARIYAKYLRPKKSEGKHPALLQFHGYTGNSGEWLDKLSWVGQGYSVLAMDVRGQGGKSQDVGGHIGNTFRGHIVRGLDGPADDMMYRQIFLDCAQLAGLAMSLPEVDPTRVGAVGGSQGGGLTLACIALEPRVKMAAPIFPFLCDYLRVWEMDLDVAAYEELRTHFRSFDPLHERESEIFNKLGYIDNQHLAPRIKADVLMAVGLMDSICPPSTQFAAYNKMTCKKDVLIYPDFGHEGLPSVNDYIFKFMGGL